MLPVIAPNTENITRPEIAAPPGAPSSVVATSAATRVDFSTRSSGRT